MHPIAALMLTLATLGLGAGEVTKLGKPLTVKEETKVSEILTQPDKYAGKAVRVKGVITDVCEERGCWIKIAGDQKGQEIMFKVDDGVISFPVSTKGSEVVAEGTVSKRVLSVDQQKAMCDQEAKAMSRKADYGKVKGPKTVVRLEGLGAEVR